MLANKRRWLKITGAVALLATGPVYYLLRTPATSTPNPAATHRRAPKPIKYPTSGEYSRGEERPISHDEVTKYLALKGHSEETLAFSFLLTRDPSYLRKALAIAPNSPLVLSVILGFNLDEFAAERSELIDRFQKANPTNALSNVLKASEFFRNSNTIEAIAELSKTGNSTQFETFQGKLQELEEDFRRTIRSQSLAHSIADGRYFAALNYGALFNGVLRDLRKYRFELQNSPHLNQVNGEMDGNIALKISELNRLGFYLTNLRGTSGGYDASLSAALGERDFGKDLPEEDFPTMTGVSKAEYLSSVDAEISRRKALADARNNVLPTLSDSEALQYLTTRRLRGEVVALSTLQPLK